MRFAAVILYVWVVVCMVALVGAIDAVGSVSQYFGG